MTKPEEDLDIPADIERDDQVLHLREGGRSYLAIAEQLGLERATTARARYLRALRRRPPAEQSALCIRELHRLDSLADHIATRKDRDQPEISRQLRMVDRLRLDLFEK
jgi:hypothetical protein